MSEEQIRDLDDLMAVFGARSLPELASSVEEAADIDDGRIVNIDATDPDSVQLVVDTKGFQIEFPTTELMLFQLAAELNQMLEDE
jgi:hypothetical protein